MLGHLPLNFCQVLLVARVERLVEVVQVVIDHVLLELEEQVAGLSDRVNKIVRDRGTIKHGLVTREFPINTGILYVRKRQL